YVSVRISCYTLSYNATQKMLVWHKPRGLTYVGRIRINNGKGEYQATLQALRRICVEYYVDPNIQDRRVKLTGSIKPVSRDFLLGTRDYRIERLLKDYTVAGDMHHRLLGVLDQLEGVAKSNNVGRAADEALGKLVRFRDDCVKRLKDSSCTAAIELLKSVADDASRRAGFISKMETKARKGFGDAENESTGKGRKKRTKDMKDARPQDVPDGSEAQSGAESERSRFAGGGAKRKLRDNNGDFSADRLRVDAAPAPAIHRAEVFVRFLTELRSIVEEGAAGKAVDAREVRKMDRFLEKLMKKFGRHAPAGTVAVARQILDALKGSAAPEEEGGGKAERVRRCKVFQAALDEQLALLMRVDIQQEK
ncbi:MAG: hypothetical protein ACYTAF_07200, partial [Planctomycetota bacterium]